MKSKGALVIEAHAEGDNVELTFQMLEGATPTTAFTMQMSIEDYSEQDGLSVEAYAMLRIFLDNDANSNPDKDELEYSIAGSQRISSMDHKSVEIEAQMASLGIDEEDIKSDDLLVRAENLVKLFAVIPLDELPEPKEHTADCEGCEAEQACKIVSDAIRERHNNEATKGKHSKK